MYPASTFYAINGRDIAGCLAVDPAFEDAEAHDLVLGTEQLYATHPTCFSVRFGRVGSLTARLDGTVPKTDPVLLVDGTEVLPPLTSLNRGFRTDFDVRRRTGAWTSAPAAALTTAITMAALDAILTFHEAEASLVAAMDNVYAEFRAADRRKAARADLRAAEGTASLLEERIQRLRTYLDADATAATSQ